MLCSVASSSRLSTWRAATCHDPCRPARTKLVLSPRSPIPDVPVQCVAQLLQFGYFFTSVKVVYSDHELLKATLEEMRLMVQQGKDDPDWEVRGRGAGTGVKRDEQEQGCK